MKNLIVALFFATLSLGLPYAMAQQSVVASASDGDNQELVTDAPETSESKDGNRRIVIDIDTKGAREVEDELREAVDTVRQLFGDSIGSELASEIDSLSDEERKKVRNKLQSVFGDTGGFNVGGKDGIRIGSDHGGVGFSEFLIAMTAIIFTLGLPVIILVLVLVFSNRKRKQKMAVISSYLEADQPVPEFVMAEFGSSSAATTSFRSGLTFLLVGIAISIFLGIEEDLGAATLGLIPIGIGIARLVSWKYDNNQSNNQSNNVTG
jgi:hypothetical protein